MEEGPGVGVEDWKHAAATSGPSPPLDRARMVIVTQFPCFPFVSSLADQWGQKAIRRKTTGTGRMRHLKLVYRRFKCGFRNGERWGVRAG